MTGRARRPESARAGDGVTGYGRAVQWLAGRLEGVDDGFRRDVAATACEVRAGARTGAQLREIGSLAGLVLRLRSRSRTAGRPLAAWRQGAYVGGVVLGFVLAVDLSARAWAAAMAPFGADAGAAGDMAVGAAGWGAGWAAAVAACCAVGFGALGRRRVAVLFVPVAAVLAGLSQPGGDTVGPVSGCALVVLAFAAGDPGAARRRPGAAALLAAAPVPAGVALAVTGPVGSGILFPLVFAVLGPALLLALGWFDPRLAVAGTVVLVWRLAASAVAELVAALSLLATDGDGMLLLRWVAMGSGVAVAVWITQSRVRSLAEL